MVTSTATAVLYLLVKEANKYWRMNYRYEGKHKTLALAIYPEVSLAEAREGRVARHMLSATSSRHFAAILLICTENLPTLPHNLHTKLIHV